MLSWAFLDDLLRVHILSPTPGSSWYTLANAQNVRAIAFSSITRMLLVGEQCGIIRAYHLDVDVLV